ncbi:MAG: hypothetical protein LBT43_01920 [Prevotella sp.]|jgi:hypothetical protein|nr:hypothetical protein [Prevotella sp.]
MLSDFFRINLPYGLARNEKGEWMAFNREYKPLGFNTTETSVDARTLKENSKELPLFSLFFGLTNRFIQEITEYDESAVNRDEQGNIHRFWLYNDSTNPMNQLDKDTEYWVIYWKKLEKIARLNVHHNTRW